MKRVLEQHQPGHIYQSNKVLKPLVESTFESTENNVQGFSTVTVKQAKSVHNTSSAPLVENRATIIVQPNNNTTVPTDAPEEKTVEQKPKYNVNDLVRVQKQANEEGGVGRVVKLHDGGIYSVKLVVGNRKIKVTETIMQPTNVHTMSFESNFGNKESQAMESMQKNNSCELSSNGTFIEKSVPIQHTTAFEDIMKADEETNDFNLVRRTTRRPGGAQLKRPDVVQLIKRLQLNDPTDDQIKVLKLKNYLKMDTNSLVLTQIFNCLETCTSVQALYVHNLEQAMDDERLEHLIQVLQRNKNIWALNVGENYQITPEGWERFAEALKNTHVTHLYAGSESTVSGELKVRMRDAIRENRKKHNTHCDPSNIGVINRIGQMWWNPKNSKKLNPISDSTACNKLDDSLCKVGNIIRYFCAETGWRKARVIEYDQEHDTHFVKWMDEETDLKGDVWLSLPQLSYMIMDQVVLAKVPSFPWWPAIRYKFHRYDFSEEEIAAQRKGKVYVIFVHDPKFGTQELGAWVNPSTKSLRDFSKYAETMQTKQANSKTNSDALQAAYKICWDEISLQRNIEHKRTTEESLK